MLINEVLLLGTIAREPEVSFSDNGAQIARTALCLTEERDSQTYKTFVPVEAWGKSAETLGDLSRGATGVGRRTARKRVGGKSVPGRCRS
jgi:single-stranded DNA-binding protein